MKLRLIVCFFALSFLVACSAPPSSNEKIEPFTFVDQYSNSYGTDDLSGYVWIANFIFTDCHTVCQSMTAEMASLQEKLKEADLPVKFISFTVDPEVDTPEKLQTYMNDFTNDATNWHFLTGYSQDAIEQFAREQFNTIVQKPSSSTQVIHSTSFYLIDPNGYQIGEYNYIDPAYYVELMKDIEKRLK